MIVCGASGGVDVEGPDGFTCHGIRLRDTDILRIFWIEVVREIGLRGIPPLRALSP